MSDLAEQIEAFLAINATGKVSHPTPGLAVELLEKALQSLRSQSLSTQQPMGEVRVKALEWEGNVAVTRLARYQVDKTAMGWTWVVMAGGGFVSTKYYPTEDGAKAGAQGDYEARILSSLHPNQESGE